MPRICYPIKYNRIGLQNPLILIACIVNILSLLDIQSFRIEDVGLNYHDQVPVGNAFGGFCLDLVRAIGCKRDLPFLIVASGVGLQNQVYILFSFLSRRNCDGISADLGGNLIIAVSCIGEYPSLVIRSVKRANLRNAAIVDIIRFIVIIHLHIQRLMPVLDEPAF